MRSFTLDACLSRATASFVIRMASLMLMRNLGGRLGRAGKKDEEKSFNNRFMTTKAKTQRKPRSIISPVDEKKRRLFSPALIGTPKASYLVQWAITKSVAVHQLPSCNYQEFLISFESFVCEIKMLNPLYSFERERKIRRRFSARRNNIHYLFRCSVSH